MLAPGGRLREEDLQLDQSGMRSKILSQEEVGWGGRCLHPIPNFRRIPTYRTPKS